MAQVPLPAQFYLLFVQQPLLVVTGLPKVARHDRRVSKNRSVEREGTKGVRRGQGRGDGGWLGEVWRGDDLIFCQRSMTSSVRFMSASNFDVLHFQNFPRSVYFV